MQQVDEREHCREHAADELHQPRAHQVAHTLHIAHDARDQRSGAVLVVVGHRKQPNVLLHLPAHIGNQALPRLREQLRERERCDRLQQHRRKNVCDEARQQSRIPVRRQDLIQKRLAGIGQDQTGDPVHRHQAKPNHEQSLARHNQRPDLRPEFFDVDFAFRLVGLASARAPPMRRTLRAHPHAHSAAHRPHALDQPCAARSDKRPNAKGHISE